MEWAKQWFGTSTKGRHIGKPHEDAKQLCKTKVPKLGDLRPQHSLSYKPTFAQVIHTSTLSSQYFLFFHYRVHEKYERQPIV